MKRADLIRSAQSESDLAPSSAARAYFYFWRFS
jgi:hypothetical protein